MKAIYLYLFIFIFLSSCKVVDIKDNNKISSVKKENVKAVLVYEYKDNGSSYCEVKSYLIFGNKKYYFFDNKSKNSKILRKNNNLRLSLDSNIVYDHLDLDSNTNIDLTSYKNKSINTHGFSIVKSSAIYKRINNDTIIYIAFNFEGEVLHYYNTLYYVENENNEIIEKPCCERLNIDVYNEFMILYRILKIYELDDEQKKTLNLLDKNMNEFKISYCE